MMPGAGIVELSNLRNEACNQHKLMSYDKCYIRCQGRLIGSDSSVSGNSTGDSTILPAQIP